MPGRVDEWRDSVVVPPSTQTTPGRAGTGRRPPSGAPQSARSGAPHKTPLGGGAAAADATPAAAGRPQSAPAQKTPTSALRPIGRMPMAAGNKNRFQYSAGGVNSDRAFISKLKGEILKIQRRIDALQNGGDEVTSVSHDMRDLEQRLFHYQYDVDPSKLLRTQVGLLEMLVVGMKNLAASLTMHGVAVPHAHLGGSAPVAPLGCEGAAAVQPLAASAPAGHWGSPMQGMTAKALRTAATEGFEDSRIEPIISLADFVCDMMTSFGTAGVPTGVRSAGDLGAGITLDPANASGSAAAAATPHAPSQARASISAAVPQRSPSLAPTPPPAPVATTAVQTCQELAAADDAADPLAASAASDAHGMSGSVAAATAVAADRKLSKETQRQMRLELDALKKGKIPGYGFAGLDSGFLEAHGVRVLTKHSQLDIQDAGFVADTLEGLLATVKRHLETLQGVESGADAAGNSPRQDEPTSGKPGDKGKAKAAEKGKDAKGGKDAKAAAAAAAAAEENAGPTEADIIKAREKTIGQLHTVVALQNTTLKAMQGRMREAGEVAARQQREDANTIIALRQTVATLKDDLGTADSRAVRDQAELRRELETKTKEVAQLEEALRVQQNKKGPKKVLLAHQKDPPGEETIQKSMVKRINEQGLEIKRLLAELEEHRISKEQLQRRFDEVQRDHSSLQRLLQTASMQNTEHADTIRTLKAEAVEGLRRAEESMAEKEKVQATKEHDEDVIRKTSIELDICRSTIAMLRDREKELLTSADEKEWKWRYVREEADEVKRKVAEENTRLQLEIEQLNQTAAAYEKSEQDLRSRLQTTEKIEKKLLEKEHELDSLQRDFKNFTLSKARQGESSADDERRLQECLIMMNTDLFNLPEGATKEDIELMTEQLEGKRRRLLADQQNDTSYKSHMSQIVDLLKGKMNVIQMYAFKEKRKILQLDEDLRSTKHLLALSQSEHKSDISQCKKIALKLKTEMESLASAKKSLDESNASIATLNQKLHDKTAAVAVLEQRVSAQQAEIVNLAVELEKMKGPKSSVRPLSAGSVGDGVAA